MARFRVSISGSPLQRDSSFSMSMIRWKPSRNQMSILVMWLIFWGEKPRRRASATTKRRSSVTWTSRSSISSVYRPSSLSSFRARTFSSRERMAFISAPSKELAMAMTSPVAFI